jgi:hypothetical protein
MNQGGMLLYSAENYIIKKPEKTFTSKTNFYASRVSFIGMLLLHMNAINNIVNNM